jgi:hypothetical protein
MEMKDTAIHGNKTFEVYEKKVAILVRGLSKINKNILPSEPF